MNIRNLKIFLIMVGLTFAFSGLAESSQNKYYYIYLDKATIAKGYTVSDENQVLKLSLVPGILNADTGVDIIELQEPLNLPWKLNKVSQAYQYEFRNKTAYDNHKPFYIQFSYIESSDNLKQVFFFDKNYNTWRPLPTRDFPEEKFVRSLIHLPYARIAVFSYPRLLGSGKASWYAYKNGDFAASPDFPKGSRLRVHNLQNGKYVDVTVNDYGPDRTLHPDRAVDLDKVAFSKIASLGDGIINVKVEPLYIAPDARGYVLGVQEQGIATTPEISAKSAVILSVKNNQIVWSKNSAEKMPLASLTKMIAVKTFLETNPDLNRMIDYQIQDEEYNYQYCKKYESARLLMEAGEKISIKDLIYSSLIASTNNTVETLVRASGLKRDDFIRKMNENVLTWGASSTNFVEPTGLSPENVSSSLDYVIISKAILSDSLISQISVLSSHEISIYSGADIKKKIIKNTNLLVREQQIALSGSKTGYLEEAGHCLMNRVDGNDDNDLIIVTFGAENRDLNYQETKDLINYGFKLINY